MAIGEQIELIVKSLTGNNIPPSIVKIKKAYFNNVVDIELPGGKIQSNIQSSGLGTDGANALLINADAPFVLLFEDARTVINSLGLGLFNIKDGDLLVELPNNINNPFNITNNNLTVELTGNNEYYIENNELKYDKEDLI